MKVYRLKNLEDFMKFKELTKNSYSLHLDYLETVKPTDDKTFFVRGYSYPAKEVVDFACDFKYGNGYPNVNWRERIICPKTNFNNRTRASIHLADMFLNLYENSNIYIMEQVTPLFAYFKSIYPNTIGSEFLDNEIPLGGKSKEGIRNEDATKLTFTDNSLDAVMSFDVFEHIPNFNKAFTECYRCLKEGGCLLFSAPFSLESNKNIVRATINIDGSINHILQPEYHGDPINQQGVLCYQHFGWEILDELRSIGFKNVFGVIFWSEEFGYYEQKIQFIGYK
jgi:SAM-dependent methyltransferase